MMRWKNAPGIKAKCRFCAAFHGAIPQSLNPLGSSPAPWKNGGKLERLSGVTSLRSGALGVARTRDPLLRKQVLYPIELRGQKAFVTAEKRFIAVPGGEAGI
jgi:hypothetical protein